MPCSSTYDCWLHAHPVIAWILIVLAALAMLGFLFYSIRNAIALSKMDREAAARRAEEHRENEALSRRLWRTIRMSEEWNIDVRDLRLTREEFDFRRKANRLLSYRRLNIFFPLLPVGLLCTFFSFILVPWVEWTVIAVFLLAVIWAIVQFGRYLWLKRIVKKLVPGRF